MFNKFKIALNQVLLSTATLIFTSTLFAGDSTPLRSKPRFSKEEESALEEAFDTDTSMQDIAKLSSQYDQSKHEWFQAPSGKKSEEKSQEMDDAWLKYISERDKSGKREKYLNLRDIQEKQDAMRKEERLAAYELRFNRLPLLTRYQAIDDMQLPWYKRWYEKAKVTFSPWWQNRIERPLGQRYRTDRPQEYQSLKQERINAYQKQYDDYFASLPIKEKYTILMEENRKLPWIWRKREGVAANEILKQLLSQPKGPTVPLETAHPEPNQD